MTTSAIELVLNGRRVCIPQLPVTTTLLEYLRGAGGLPGTKEGCAEGDCGACSVAVLDRGAPEGPAWRAINACLVPVASLHGRTVVTVEGLAAGGEHHPAQQAMIDTLGSQCGYCTPGVVMSLFEATYRDDLDAPWKLDDQLCGNLCRCTGYRPIRDAAAQVAGSRPDDAFVAALEAPEASTEPLAALVQGEHFIAPRDLPSLWRAMEQHPDARLIAGATDLGLAITQRHERFAALISLLEVPRLRGITDTEAGWRIGATTRLSDLETWADTHLVPMARMLRFFGSRQIKNGATLGGNLVNASPIGDLAPVLLALDAVLVLASPTGDRRVGVDDFFESYRKTALRPGEILAAVEVEQPGSTTRLGAYKVSKRREMDISAVAAAMAVRTDLAGVVTHARLAYGGMAATPARAHQAEAALVGQAWGPAAIEQAVSALAQDFTPMSDHRGSAWYRSTVAANLLRGFYEETHEQAVVRLPDAPSGTVVIPEVQP